MDTPLHIGICEDEDCDADLLLDYINKSGIPVNCSTFSSGEELLENFHPHLYDLIFFDIYMKGIRGIDAASKIRQSDDNVIFAFATGSLEHTLESYRLGALKYLEKPVKAADVRELMELAFARRKSKPRVTFMVEGKNLYIIQDDIIYIEQKNHKVIINTFYGSIRGTQRIKLSDVENILPYPPFFRCHQSYLANLNHIKKLDKELKVFIMANDDTVYIRRQNLGAAQRAYEDTLFSSTRGVRI